MAKENTSIHEKPTRRRYTKEFREEAVQMMLDGHSAASVAERLGLSGTNILYRWKQQVLASSGPAAGSLEQRLREVEAELRRTRQERDILKKVAPGKVRERGMCYDVII
jgi:transposase